MAENNDNQQTNNQVEQAVAEGGAYEVIHKRLLSQGKQLENLTQSLNQSRQQEFGSTDMQVLSRLRLRTENNCEARDLVLVGDFVLFGYNAFLGLRKETKIEDVFSIYKLIEKNDELELEVTNVNKTFLADQSFAGDFRELYTYYKNTTLSQLVVKDSKLLASFQIGDKITDVRVFRWNISADGKQIEYIDNRGERDIELPSSHDFEWVECLREDIIEGRHPHINILDTIFIDTLQKNLTIKVEDNTNTGQGIYSEPVEDASQSLDDASFYYSEVGSLILLKIKPYREEKWRYLVFNSHNQQVERIDAIGDSCVRLPEDHGLMFPGGYYLTTGEKKFFDHEYQDLKFKRTMKSPNGEDVLYIFYQPQANLIGLFAYNLINKSLQNPLFGHGYGFYPDGRLIIFYAQEEATRVHPVQIWQTPFISDEFASKQPPSQTFFGKIGNAELVRGISELFSITRLIKSDDVSSIHFNDLSKRSEKIFDNFHWLTDKNLTDIKDNIKSIAETSELVIDEYEKVASIQKQSLKALREAEQKQQTIIRELESSNWQTAQEYVAGLNELRQQRGHLLTIRELRYIDTQKIDQLEKEITQQEESLNQRTVDFLSSEAALESFYKEIKQINQDKSECNTVAELKPLLNSVEEMAAALDLLSELMATLKVPDATLQTRIIESISDVYAQLNQLKAKLTNQQQNFGAEEATAQFSAQFKLLSQSVQNALGLATTPERCDEQLSRLLVQLEELEGQFGDFDEFLADILSKRDEIFEAFESHKQNLLQNRQRKAQTLFDAATRILQSIKRRSQKFTEQDKLNSFFASDRLILKVQQIAQQLSDLDDAIKSDDLNSQLKAAKENAIRSLRDKSDIYEDGGQIIKLGPRHKFSVNTQDLDVTLLPRHENLYVHLTGTDFYQELDNDELISLKPYWSMSTPSESDTVYRAEFLAYSIMNAARANTHGFNWDELLIAINIDEDIQTLVKDFIAPKYKEGYDKGVHDYDAIKILKPILTNFNAAGSLRFTPEARAIATIYWVNNQNKAEQKLWPQRAQNALRMSELFSTHSAKEQFGQEISLAFKVMLEEENLPFDEDILVSAADYLIMEIGQTNIRFAVSKYADELVKSFKLHLETNDAWQNYQKALDSLSGKIGKRWYLTYQWLTGFNQFSQKTTLTNYIPEAVALLNAENRLDRHVHQVDLSFKVDDLIGQHKRIKNQSMTLTLDEFLQRLSHHENVVVPRYHRYHEIRQQQVEIQRKKLRVEDFIPKPLTSFVRNKLINEAYLPVIGDNLAKQMGTVGDKKRTDLMGLLLMISPPGYGKTTLMEYVASRLGLIFMKINCPSIGHDITSIDPNQAKNSATRQELEKLNLALEMGNNVMLYLDDIQHTNPEFLQKFISLCDGTRRIEGIWDGNAKTYDMRGKKFCVVMAGNPYTESGELFRIPDMLANRADIYNLGDMLSGQEEVFELSYVENSLTSNAILAPLATREMSDIYKLIDMAKGGSTATTDLSHQYSGAEINEMTNVFKKLFKIQKIVSKINQQYILSSAQDDKYRDEPPFKLQGSYRNMNKMAEKISAVMTDDELEKMIDDHYQGESQLLTTGAEENLLKLGELRNSLNEQQQKRWNAIKQDFKRNLSIGGDDSNAGDKIVLQLNDLVNQISKLSSTFSNRVEHKNNEKEISSSEAAVNILANKLDSFIKNLKGSQPPNVEVINQPVPGIEKLLSVIADTFENSIKPLIRVMDGKLNLDLKTHEKMTDIEGKLSQLNDTIISKRKNQTTNKGDTRK